MLKSIGILLGIGHMKLLRMDYFTHIDTRTTKSFWYGQNEQPRTTFGGTPAALQIEYLALQLPNPILKVFIHKSSSQ